jgi:hypothetical protein
MKKIFVVASLALLAACNSSDDSAKVESTKSATDSTTIVGDINSPYPVEYSSKFAAGDPKSAETILALWKIWEAGDLSLGKDRFADSIEMHFADGSSMQGKRDSVLAGAQAYRSTLASSISTVQAVTAVRSTDKGEDWALIWGKEVNTDKKGKKDSSYLQETWRLNKDGKVDLLFQFRAAAAPPKK